MLKKYYKVWFLVLLTLGGAACGNSAQQTVQTSTSPSSSTPGVTSPSAGNLPPPGSDDSLTEALEAQNTIFFQRKEIWDTFSDELKAKVMENYSHSGTMTGSGPYYNTLFGRTNPQFGNTHFSPPSVKIDTPRGPVVYKTMALISSSCDAGATFLCVDRPTEGENTVVDSTLVQGSINMTQAALFNPTDPIIMVSVFKQSGEAVNEYPLKAADITVTPPASPGDPEIGTFSKTVGLAGPGTYAVVISAFKDTGDSVELVSQARTVVRQDVPEIELVELKPPPEGNLYPTDPQLRDDPVNPGDTVSMATVKVTVKLKSPGTQNVGIIFQNLDEGGTVRYVSSGDASFGTTDPDTDGNVFPTKSATVILFPGLNHIKMTAHNTVLDTLGLSPATPSTIDVNLTDVFPAVNIKLISPEDGSIVQATNDPSQRVTVRFCLTDLPGLPGRPSPAPTGQCITGWTGQKPVVGFNGYSLTDSEVTFNASDGNYSAIVKPILGGNVINISVTNSTYAPPAPPASEGGTPNNPPTLGNLTASFGFGKVNKLYENGALKEKDNFLSRGISLEINKKILTEDVKKMLIKFLNKPDFEDTIKSSFGSAYPSAPNVCWEYGTPSNSTGDSTVEFLTEGFDIGEIEIPTFEPRNDNLLALQAVIHGFHAKANLRGLNAPQVTYGGVDAGFIPLDIQIKNLTVTIGARFVKRDGVSQLDIVPLERDENDLPKILTIEGDIGTGAFVQIDSERNPSATGLELMEKERGSIAKQFAETLNRTILCGIENGINPPQNFNVDSPPSSGIGYWIADLQKLVGYNNLNPFRIPLEFDILNKLVGIDISYDALRGDITFNDRGVQIRNVPVRINASPRVLNNLSDTLKNSLLGSLSLPNYPTETPPANPLTNDTRNFGVEISEDAINQALFAANLAGLLDLDIDPNFYTNNGIGFIDLATPTVEDMLGQKIDLNGNGVDDDGRLPIQMQLRTSKTQAPLLHFLSATEVDDLDGKINKVSTASTSGDGEVTEKGLNKNLKYFRLTLNDLEIEIYRVYPLGAEVGGIKKFCSLKDPLGEPAADANARPMLPHFMTQNGEVSMKRACSQSISSFFEKPAGASCPDSGDPQNPYSEVTIPVKNGPVISAVPNQEGVPVVRFKANLVLHGVIQGIFRETLAVDKYEVNPNAAPVALVEKPGAKPKNFLRMKFLTNELNPAQPLITLRAVENHTPFSQSQLNDRLARVLILAALGEDCQRLNEIRISLPDRFPSDTAQSEGGLVETLHDFDVKHLDFGDEANELPQVLVDDNHLYLDLLLHVGVCYEGEPCSNLRLFPGIIQQVQFHRLINWAEH